MSPSGLASSIARFTGLVAPFVVLASACSSVPDVQFVDVDAGTPGKEAGTSSGDGGSEAGAPNWSCPGSPPPAGAGVCCGTRLCLKCQQSDCGKCEQEGCSGTLSDVCCARNTQQLQCRASTDCL